MSKPYTYHNTCLNPPTPGICLAAAAFSHLPPGEEFLLQCFWDLAAEQEQAVSLRTLQAYLLRRGESPAYTTIATVARRLVQKGYLLLLPAQRGAGKALRYAPALSYQQYRQELLCRFLRRYPPG